MTRFRDREAEVIKVLALAIVTSILSVLLFSLVFIADRAGHDCCKDHCSVCESIRQCADNLRTSAAGTEKTAALFIMAAAFTAVFRLSPQRSVTETLISQKVRSNS